MRMGVVISPGFVYNRRKAVSRAYRLRCLWGYGEMSCRIIAAFVSEKNTDNIASVLENHGVAVNCRCRSGQEIIAAAEETGSAVVICGAEFSDMSADDLSLWIDVPAAFLVLGTPDEIKNCRGANVFTLALPVKGGELAGSVNTLTQLVAKKEALLKLSIPHDEELAIVKAENLLVKKAHISEDQAREYIRRKSMETSSRMSSVAVVILKTLG